MSLLSLQGPFAVILALFEGIYAIADLCPDLFCGSSGFCQAKIVPNGNALPFTSQIPDIEAPGGGTGGITSTAQAWYRGICQLYSCGFGLYVFEANGC